MFPQAAHLPLQAFQPAADRPPVLLQLGFARTAGADAAALAREAGSSAAQPRQAVAQLRELHLQAAGTTGCPLGKDVEDELAAVTHRQIEDPLKVP